MKKLVSILLLAAVIVGIINFIPYASDFLFPTTYKRQIETYSEKYGVDISLIYAIIKAESNFNKNATSSKGAKGLMQLMDDTASWCSSKCGVSYDNIYNINTNLELGTFYISYLLDKYDGEETLALAAYNAGQGNVDKWLSDPDVSIDGKKLTTIPFDETDKYIKKITVFKKIYAYKGKYAK